MPTIRRSILEVNAASELIDRCDFKDGDQVRIRVKLDGKNLSSWPVEQQLILDWAKKNGVYIASLEAAITGDSVKDTNDPLIEIPNPEQVLQQYAQQEKLSDDILQMGLSLLSE